MKRRSKLTQNEALVLLRSEQMEPNDYLSLCEEMAWDPMYGLREQQTGPGPIVAEPRIDRDRRLRK